MCTPNCEVKRQLAELMTMLEPILTKINQLKQLVPDEIGSVSSDATENSGNSREEQMDESPPPNQHQSQVVDSGLPLGSSQNVNMSRRLKRPRTELEPNDDVQASTSPTHTPSEEQSDISPLCNLVFRHDGGNSGQNGAHSQPVDTKLMRSVYLTPFSPSTEPADVINHLNRNAIVRPLSSDFKITKLVKKNNKMELSFVSFKLDVPRQYFDMITAVDIWPEFITATQFNDKSVKPSAPANRSSSIVNPKNRSQQQNLTSKAAHPKSKNSSGTVRNQRLKPALQTSNRQFNIQPRKSQRQRKLPNMCQKSCCQTNRHRTVVKRQNNGCRDHYGENRHDFQRRCFN